MSSIKVDIEYVDPALSVTAAEKPSVGRESPAPSATSLSGEWIPLPEAIAWIIFRDFGKARHLREASPSRMSVEYGFAQAGIDPTSPVMAPREAQDALMNALRQGSVPAMGRHRLGDGELILLEPEQWAHLKFEDHAAAPWGAACKRTLAFFCDLLVNANRLLETFPESIEQTEDETPLKAENPENFMPLQIISAELHGRNGVDDEASTPTGGGATQALYLSADLVGAYHARVASWNENRPPSEEQDWAFLKSISPSITRDRMRDIRKAHAPDTWKKRGRPAKEKAP